MAYRLSSAVVVAVGIALSGYFIGSALQAWKAADRYVTVKGLAEKKVKADSAIWKISFNAADDKLAQLYQSVHQAQDHIKTFLTKQGFNVSNIQIEPVSINDNASNSYNSNSHAKRFTANDTITVTTDNVNGVVQAQQNVGNLVQEGVVVSQSNVRYLYTALNNIKPAMLTLATKNARKAAKTFAVNSQSTLGGIRMASQGLFSIKNANDSYGDSDPNKVVRVVTTVQYFLKG